MTKSPSLLHGCFGLVLVLLLSHCQSKKAQPPQAEGFDPPIPETMSYVAGPIVFQLGELQKKINQELDPVLVGKQTKEGKVKGFMSFRVKRLGPVQVEYTNQKVSLSAPLQMWLTKPFSKDTTPPKKPFCALNVHFQTPIRVTPNWRFASQTKFTNYTWIKEPELRVLGQDISLTKVVQDILDKHRVDIETMIDSAIHQYLRLDNMVRPVWHDLQKPLLINRDYGLWLVPIPVSVAAGPVTGNASQLTTHIRMAFRTRTELKPSTPVYPKTPLPRLQKRDTVSQVSDLHLMSFIPYADINRIMKLTISKQPKKMALGAVTIKGVSVYGAQRALVVKVDMDGLVDGPVYLRGRPEFDTLTNTLKVADLDFDTQTSNVLARTTKPVWHKPLQLLLKQLLTIRLGDDIAKFPDKINEAFEKGGAGKKTDLTIRTFRFVPQKIAIRPDGIQALIKVESQVGLKINRL